MKKIIPFKKEMLFKTNVSEITSISLEHTLQTKNNNVISGDFSISGEYKISDKSINTEYFEFLIPCDIHLDDHYSLDNIKIDIDDFYYEVVNSNMLEVNIDVLIDRLEEQEVELINEVNNDPISLDDMELVREENIEDLKQQLEEESIVNNRCIEDEKKEIDTNRCIEEENVKSLFDNFNDNSETYKTYRVYIVRDGDSIESIIGKYNITKEELEQYNDLKEINLGDKIIIPDILNEKD